MIISELTGKIHSLKQVIRRIRELADAALKSGNDQEKSDAILQIFGYTDEVLEYKDVKIVEDIEYTWNVKVNETPNTRKFTVYLERQDFKTREKYSSAGEGRTIAEALFYAARALAEKELQEIGVLQRHVAS